MPNKKLLHWSFRIFFLCCAKYGASYAKFFPPYCHKDLNQNAIPELTRSTRQKVEILQVQVIIRHGARAPYSEGLCWEGYNATWDCDAMNMMLPILGNTHPLPLISFVEKFDAGENLLGGSCPLAGLLDEGFEQHIANGRHLREAYLGPGKLFNTLDLAAVIDKTYFQSDNEERTVMSGQVLVSSMFNKTGSLTVDWHTMDYKADQFLKIEPSQCPITTGFQRVAVKAQEYQDYNNSIDTVLLVEEMEEVFGSYAHLEGPLFDCLMTNLCSEKKLPPGATEDLTNRYTEWLEQTVSSQYSFENGILPKTGLQKLVRRIKERINNATTQQSPVTFAVYSGHDNTIMPLLAALGVWDQKWASYASMVSIELYKETNETGNFFFRIIYNGKELRHPGCDSDNELCPLQVLMEAMAFTNEELPCTAQAMFTDVFGAVNFKNIQDFQYGIWVGIAIICFLIGAVSGSLITFFATKKSEVPAYANLQTREEPGDDMF